MDAWQRGVVMSCMRQCKYTSMGGAHLPDTGWEITHTLLTDYPVPAVSWDFWFGFLAGKTARQSQPMSPGIVAGALLLPKLTVSNMQLSCGPLTTCQLMSSW